MKYVLAVLSLWLAACAAEKKDPPIVTAKKNRLANAKSPYLRQHDANPVDWYEWGDEAFEKARREDKPIFLSIGYSTCHWCHVMARESFENEAIAKILNDHYVSIKVDREERPDIDQVYMTAAQTLTGSGGWPLSIWMTPDRKPFYAGTYFPPDDRWGRAGFPTLLHKIAELWKEQRQHLLADADKLSEAIASADRPPKGALDAKLLDEAVAGFKAEFDEIHGGFGGAPKFPRSIVLEFLLRRGEVSMVEKTLQAMRAGGMYDQLGGGFHRYSVDDHWLVPHFEKMLYDNAFLARAYAQAYQVTGKEEYARTVRETLDYVLRDMTSKDGAFFSAEDADVDHVEGAFYLWQPAQIRAVVGDADADRVCRALGVTQEGNFESPHPEDPKGMSVLHRVEPLDDATRAKLLEARSKRKRPHLDDKILADWNGLMIGAMAFSGFVLNEPRYLAAAERAAAVALKTLRKSDGRWMHTSTIPGFLDDYALLAEGFFLLHHATFKPEYLDIAKRTAELLIADFADPAGGFFQTSKDSEKLIARMKEAYDGALPSGNSVATLVLIRLGFRKEAEQTLTYFAGTIARAPVAYPYHLCALDALASGMQEVKLEGEVAPFVELIRKTYLPNAAVEVKPGGETKATVCTNGTCALPVKTAEELRKQLK